MQLSDLIRYAMRISNTTATECAAALGISKQNFGQRLRRDSYNLEELFTIMEACGCEFHAVVTFGKESFRV